ncbi:ATP-binding protein [Aerosakkonema funiforme]|uniref:ATP-binding protein n=1 Tax=Aerosakkonema funiforme FACHB-1375 TaxID=2949571 RepID=A0A926ZMT4_9CYAN|nr:ATP-binding protein [Aerosakkonema funiforme]MBD2186381.1 ATP-binding protein [Aerosakkonema funiforme FACHB-1375]
MPPSQKSHLQLPTDLKALPQILSWFEQLHQPQIARKLWLRFQLALAEAFTNAVRHAHKNQSPEVPIDIEVTIFEDSIEIRVWDWGPPFDLHKKLSEMLSNEENDSGGGRGLQLMESITDHLSYTRTADDRNCLLMVKHYGGDSGLSQRSITDFN